MLGGSRPNSFTTGVGNSGGSGGGSSNGGGGVGGGGSSGQRSGGGGGFSNGGGSSDDFGPNPQLLIPLCTMDVVLNSGESHTFQAGHVILLENVLMGGHKLVGHEQQDMTALLLTLPYPYRHVGKDKNALTTMFEKVFWKQSPCKTGLSTTGGGGGDDDDDETNQRRQQNSLAEWVMAPPHRGVRRVGLGILGAGVSLAIADFVGKTAPFILAVMFGGGTLVVGGTFGAVKLGEYGMDQLELWHEKRLLRLEGGSSSHDARERHGDGDLSSDEEEDEEETPPPEKVNVENVQEREKKEPEMDTATLQKSHHSS